MVNCNPETVSTDYDTADRLYFEPLTDEDVLELIEAERANGTLLGVVVQYGGQTPLKLAGALEKAGIPILGTSPDAIDLSEDRERFKALLDRLGLRQPPNAIVRSEAEALECAKTLGFPLVLRPSFVLGGRGMEIVRDQESLERYIRAAVHVSGDSPLLLDRYLTDASEVDVDAILRRGRRADRRRDGAYRGSRCSFRRQRLLHTRPIHCPKRSSPSCAPRQKRWPRRSA